MEIIKNSCGRRGCELRIILPICRVSKYVSTKLLRTDGNIPKVLRTTGLSMDQVEEKKAA